MALGLPVPAGPSLGPRSFLSRESARGLARRLGWLRPRLLLGRHMLHQGTDGPSQRLLVAVDGVVIGGMLSLPLALGQIIPLAIHPIDQLTEHAGVDPPLAVPLAQVERLQL